MLTAYGFFYYQRRQIYLRRLDNDRKEHQIAVYPLALAEADRAYVFTFVCKVLVLLKFLKHPLPHRFLRQLRHNRHVERDLMKNVPDWKVGTLWGFPVYYNQPEDKLPNVSLHEYYAHRDTWNMRHPTRPNWDVGFENTTD